MLQKKLKRCKRKGFPQLFFLIFLNSKITVMKKIHFSLLLCMIAFVSCQKDQSEPIQSSNLELQSKSSLVTTLQTLPITAVSFPKEVIDVNGGKIEFWAKLNGYGGQISVGGTEAHFFQVYDGTSTFHMGFNANDGAADGGLVGMAGASFACGSGIFGNYTYESIYGTGNVNKWHCYVFAWDKDGVKWLNNVNKKVAIYIDGVLNTTSWHAINQQKFLPLTAGVFNLITTGNPPLQKGGDVTIDELKIYDRRGKLVLWNTLGSADEITHSKVGPNGSFNGGGDAHFVPGRSGNAVSATPVEGIGNL